MRGRGDDEESVAGEAPGLGVSFGPGGTRFRVFSKDAEAVELLLFDGVEDDKPSRIVEMRSAAQDEGRDWELVLDGIEPGQLYGYRVRGPHDPGRGLRCDGEKLLLDPYAHGVATPERFSRLHASAPGANLGTTFKSVALDVTGYDWLGDEAPRRPWRETVIYEMHVAGFTKHPSSGVPPERRGRYLGVIDKIPHLLELGVTAVELLPVFQFDVQDAPVGLTNYWGYSPVSFFAPHLGYASRADAAYAVSEFREMVRALHAAGIEVILDVVFNHTAEYDASGPTYCYRGLSNDVYYMLADDPAEYRDYTGTGNTLNANHPVVQRMIVDSLRHWVLEMHVDGFRFDLASALTRAADGELLSDPPLIQAITDDEVLGETKLIAEAWDGGGAYQVGHFPGVGWREWNGGFRDGVRSFVRGDEGALEGLQEALGGSPELYGHKGLEPDASINFVSCHDGFTLADLVSYEEKHNEANLGDAQSGSDWNLSSNHGVEGPTERPDVLELRERQIKNFATILLLSFGTPMLLMGDEVRRTQHGNNNPYCVDSELSWFDWGLRAENAELFRFFRELIALRARTGLGTSAQGLPLAELASGAVLTWHGVQVGEPDLAAHARVLACGIEDVDGAGRWHLLLNGSDHDLEFELPRADSLDRAWRRVIDTALPSPQDLTPPEAAPRITTRSYWARPRTTVLLHARGSARS